MTTDYTRAVDPNDPRFNHCLKKEIVRYGVVDSELITNGKAPIGTPIDLFIKLVDTRKFSEYSLHTFITKDGSIVTFYGTIKNSPVKIEDVAVDDCIEVHGRIAKYGQFKGNNQTRISHVKIIENKGSKK